MAPLSIAAATAAEAAAVATLRNEAAARLTVTFGTGHWSGLTTEGSVRRGIETSRVLVAWAGEAIVATLRLATKKPWAIDPRYFAPSTNVLYLVDMAVHPDVQRQGYGLHLLEAAATLAQEWQADAIRLDAYDHAAGAGTFYEKGGFEEVGRVTYRGVPLIYYQMIL